MSMTCKLHHDDRQLSIKAAHLNIFLQSLPRLAGVDLVSTEEVQAAGVNPLAEDVFSQGPRHHVPLQQRHPTVEQAEPRPGSSNVSRHRRARLANLVIRSGISLEYYWNIIGILLEYYWHITRETLATGKLDWIDIQ